MEKSSTLAGFDTHIITAGHAAAAGKKGQGPRQSTLARIRQFSRAYCALPLPAPIAGVILN